MPQRYSGVPARDDNLTLIEELELGPYEHKSPFDDPLFERLEPHFRDSPVLPYEDLQAYMTGRYYISPSKLYSIVRAHPGAGAGARGQVYDVPVVGDWVTIAVVAERSPIRVSRAPVTLAPGEARDADDPGPIPSPSAPPPHRSSKSANKDPPPRAGRKEPSRGDAVLSLLLFESDSYDTVSRGDGLLPEKIYKGGGRGAFEAMAKLREGTVVALLNPRVLKPIQKPGAPNVLALTPESAASIAVIGIAQDLGMCSVVKRDSEVCDYHVQHAVERRRAARPEFSSGTSGMGAGSSSLKRKAAAYDPQRKWGLAPGDDSAPPSSVGEGATYVVAGHVVASGKRDLFVGENVGREAQARAARKAGSRDVDKALKRLLVRDKEGMKAVQEARAFAKKMKDQQKTAAKPGKEGPSGTKKQKGDDVSEADSWTEEEDESDGASATDKPTKNAYSAQVIKQLGFDPTRKSAKGQSREEDASSIYSKLAELASRREPDKISLTHRPGGRVLSVVSAPKKKEDDDLVDLDESSDDELVILPLLNGAPPPEGRRTQTEKTNSSLREDTESDGYNQQQISRPTPQLHNDAPHSARNSTQRRVWLANSTSSSASTDPATTNERLNPLPKPLYYTTLATLGLTTPVLVLALLDLGTVSFFLNIPAAGLTILHDATLLRIAARAAQYHLAVVATPGCFDPCRVRLQSLRARSVRPHVFPWLWHDGRSYTGVFARRGDISWETGTGMGTIVALFQSVHMRKFGGPHLYGQF
ncbi:hypothetical protein EDB87DRAFT_1682576 [Lactarius vividus]|nr:hypothetical protein EDB87DRAFT_1682576 [Lactarius vividus]